MERKQSSPILAIVALTSLLLVFLAGYWLYYDIKNSQDYIYLKKTEIKNQGIDGCGKMASSVKSGEFIEYVYNLCLKDKGYR